MCKQPLSPLVLNQAPAKTLESGHGRITGSGAQYLPGMPKPRPHLIPRDQTVSCLCGQLHPGSPKGFASRLLAHTGGVRTRTYRHIKQYCRDKARRAPKSLRSSVGPNSTVPQGPSPPSRASCATRRPPWGGQPPRNPKRHLPRPHQLGKPDPTRRLMPTWPM